MTIKGLIFDFDGTIQDTEVPEYEVWKTIYQQYNCPLPISDYRVCIGTPVSGFDIIANLQKKIGKTVNTQAIKAFYDRVSHERIVNEPIKAGVMDYIQYALKNNLKLAVASSSPFSWVGKHLSRLKIDHHFNAILSQDDVERVKPDPELYNQALEKLGIQPHEAIAFEDSIFGVQAAKNAGIFCVAIPSVLLPIEEFTHADYVVESLAELPIQELLSLIETTNQLQAKRS
jgi:HAD superfamily hydrolase (TIGR01509 family)